MYQLFIFFMVTDPKTTVRAKSWQCVVVFLVAFVEMILRLNEILYAPFYALFIVGPDRDAGRYLAGVAGPRTLKRALQGVRFSPSMLR